MCARDTSGGSAASARSATASAAGSWGARRRSDCGASGAGPSRKKRSRSASSRSDEPAGRLLHPPVLLQPAGELLGRLLRVEVAELDLLLTEQLPCLQLEQRPDENEELAAGVEVDRAGARRWKRRRQSRRRPAGRHRLRRCRWQPLDEGDDDVGDVDIARARSSSRRTRVSSRSNGPSNASRSSSSSRTCTRGG